jgi:hypothetical protein
MKKTLLTIIAISGLAMPTRAALIAHWDFDFYANNQATVSAEADSAQASATLNFDPSFSTAKLISIPGTTVNDPNIASPAGTQAMRVDGKDGNNNGFFTLALSGTGLSFFTVTYAAQQSGNGNNLNQWSWSLTGLAGSFTDAGPVANIPTSAATITVDFSSVSQLNGASTIFLRNTLLGGSSGGTSDFDNIQVLAQIPEPINVALALFGLGFVGLRFGRRLCSFVRK